MEELNIILECFFMCVCVCVHIHAHQYTHVLSEGQDAG